MLSKFSCLAALWNWALLWAVCIWSGSTCSGIPTRSGEGLPLWEFVTVSPLSISSLALIMNIINYCETVCNFRTTYSNAVEDPTLRRPLNTGCNQEVPKDADDMRVCSLIQYTLCSLPKFSKYENIQRFSSQNSNTMLLVVFKLTLWCLPSSTNKELTFGEQLIAGNNSYLL